MRPSFRQGNPTDTSADTLCVGIFEGEPAPAGVDDALGGALARLIESGEAKGAFKKLATLHPSGDGGLARVVVVGLGKRDEFDPERARIAAAVASRRAAELSARAIAWAVPEGVEQEPAARALTEGVLLAAYKFDRYKSAGADEDRALETLEIVSGEDAAAAVEEAALVVEHENTARDLQNLPANDLTPSKLADHALARVAEIDGLEGEAPR